MHIITILRYYLGLTQTDLSERSGVSYADINEMENKPAYGMIDKYCKVAQCLQVPVHTIAMNDILSVPEAFFDEMPPAKYLSVAKSKSGALGREGEDTVFHQEQARLAQINPCLAKLVIPCYKLRAAKGYDILSYKEDGTPIFIEVKVSGKDNNSIQLTKHEYDTAVKVTKQGYEYWIYYYTGWNTECRVLEKIPFRDLIEKGRVSPVRYLCDIRPQKETENGILHFRKQMGITQLEAANLLEIPASCLCKYETGENQCPVTTYQKMTKLYRVTIDALLQTYASD